MTQGPQQLRMDKIKLDQYQEVEKKIISENFFLRKAPGFEKP